MSSVPFQTFSKTASHENSQDLYPRDQPEMLGRLLSYAKRAKTVPNQSRAKIIGDQLAVKKFQTSVKLTGSIELCSVAPSLVGLVVFLLKDPVIVEFLHSPFFAKCSINATARVTSSTFSFIVVSIQPLLCSLPRPAFQNELIHLSNI